MNRKYGICFKNCDNKEVKALIDVLENLDKLRDECKDKVPYFWGMRKNWFPLVLLRAAKVGNESALKLFNQLVEEKDSHSIYYKGFRSAAVDPFCVFNDDRYYVVFISIDPDNFPYVSAILNFFGLKHYFSNNFDGIWP